MTGRSTTCTERNGPQMTGCHVHKSWVKIPEAYSRMRHSTQLSLNKSPCGFLSRWSPPFDVSSHRPVGPFLLKFFFRLAIHHSRHIILCRLGSLYFHRLPYSPARAHIIPLDNISLSDGIRQPTSTLGPRRNPFPFRHASRKSVKVFRRIFSKY